MLDAGPLSAANPSNFLVALHTLFVGLVLAFIAIPVGLTLVMAFNDGEFLSFPIPAFSMRWFGEFFSSSTWTDALINSLMIALGVSVISTTAGTLAAYVFAQTRPSGLWYVLLLLPLFMPGVVLGLGIVISLGQIDILGFPLQGSRPLVVLAHSLWSTPLVFMVMESVFRMIDRRILEASADLGASPFRTFVEVTLPLVATGIISSAIFAFVVSLNEFIMALFLTTRDTQTLPVLMWLSLRSAGTPLLAVAALILVSSVVIALLGSLGYNALRRSRG